MAKKQVVIVGGGFGGIRAALDLARYKHDLDIILVDKNGYHTFTPDCYKLLVPASESQAHFNPVKFRLFFSSVTIALAEIFEGRENVELVLDEAVKINPLSQEVATLGGRQLQYDWLILAVGSVTNFFDVPGLRSRALEFKTAADALNLRNAIDEVFIRKGKNEKINIIVGGGGFTGCEVAAELSVYLKKISSIHSHPARNIKLIVIEAAPVLLATAGDWVGQKAQDRFKKLGVEIILSDPIVDVRDRTIALKSSKIIDYDVLVWTAGIKANPLTEKITGVAFVKNACIPVNDYLQVSLSPNIFVVGDAAYCRGPDEKPLPMMAQTAIFQGRYAAYAIKRFLCGREILKFYSKKISLIIPLDGHYAIANLGRLKMEGFSAWVIKRLAALKYFLSILPVKKALKLWLKGARF
ncbi:MAG: FAD-dependent oxidoreductase [Patescibacteria group bacterium]